MADVVQEISALIQVVQDTQTCRYIDVAAYVAMMYDFLNTFPQEYALVWHSRWSNGKILYFCVRYPEAIEGLLWLIYDVGRRNTEKFCMAEGFIGMIGTSLFLVPLQIIVILRTVALWERNRNIMALLVITVLATDMTVLITLVRVARILRFAPDPLVYSVLGCDSFIDVTQSTQTITIPQWIALIVFDTLIFALTLIRAVRIQSYRTRLLTVLIRDGFLYYAVMLVLAVSNLVLFITLPSSRIALLPILTPVQRASYCIIGSRLMLNMRDVVNHISPAAGNTLTTMFPSARWGHHQTIRTFGHGSAEDELVEMQQDTHRACL